MHPTTSGTFRVLPGRADRDELTLADPETAEPHYVRTGGYEGDLAAAVADLEPGNLVTATLAWEDGEARFASVDVGTGTAFAFVDDADTVFDAAAETWQAARRTNDGMNATVTRDTDGEPNGALYVFADGPGGPDLFAEFREGTRPLDPLLERLAGDYDPPYEVFVVRPAAEPFVVVYIAFERGGTLAGAMRETYDLPGGGLGGALAGGDGSADLGDVPAGDYPTPGGGNGASVDAGGSDAGGDGDFGGLSDLGGPAGESSEGDAAEEDPAPGGDDGAEPTDGSPGEDDTRR